MSTMSTVASTDRLAVRCGSATSPPSVCAVVETTTNVGGSELTDGGIGREARLPVEDPDAH